MRKTVLFLIFALMAATGLKAQNVEVEGRVNDTNVKMGKPFTIDLSRQVQ